MNRLKVNKQLKMMAFRLLKVEEYDEPFPQALSNIHIHEDLVEFRLEGFTFRTMVIQGKIVRQIYFSKTVVYKNKWPKYVPEEVKKEIVKLLVSQHWHKKETPLTILKRKHRRYKHEKNLKKQKQEAMKEALQKSFQTYKAPSHYKQKVTDFKHEFLDSKSKD